MFKRHAEIEGKKLIYRVSKSVPPFIVGDQMRLKQVMINLINNALKFTNQNGFVKINATYLKRDSRILVKIQDTGIGISKSDQQRLFKKFGKLKDACKMNNRGVGLGLIICQHLCWRHGGKIWLSSRELEGSVFSFTMVMPPADD